LRNATPERLRALIRENIDGLQAILEFNERREFRLFRLGNEFIPFASHPVNELRWWEEFRRPLREVGQWARRHGHRLSFHASHFTILNSAQPHVAEAALADITYLGRVLEAMELGPEHKVILHGGVATPTFEEAEARFEAAVARVPAEYRSHLALENDDRFYTLERVLGLSARTGLPVVVDVFHHACLPGTWQDLSCAELLRRTFPTWRAEESPPKIHFSTQDSGKRLGAHDYWVDGAELERFLEGTRSVSADFDIMFESKGKDLALEPLMPLLREAPRFQPLPLAA